MIFGYSRVSKGGERDNTAGGGQSAALQHQAFATAGVERIFADAASGGRWDRPELMRLLDQLRPGDVVVVWKLDRLSRSLKDLLAILERIDAAGAGFRSLTEAVDTTAPAGRMVMQMIGAFAEFERALIRERTRAGLAAARAEGRHGGRPPRLDSAQARDVADNVLSGRRSGAEMARLYGVSPATVSRIVARARATAGDRGAAAPRGAVGEGAGSAGADTGRG